MACKCFMVEPGSVAEIQRDTGQYRILKDSKTAYGFVWKCWVNIPNDS